MSTIKQIAEKTNLSVGTVSIVLNGRGDELRISKKTQQRIIEAAQGVGYLPNVSARRLRQTHAKNLPVIAIFWPSDLSPDLLGRFFVGAQSPLLENKTEFEMTIQSYNRNNIHRIKEICDQGIYHGVILTGISSEEQTYLEEQALSIPTVLFNRHSRIYSCAYVDTYDIGRKVAELFKARGHEKVGTIVPDYLINSKNNLRFKGFVESCQAYGLQLDERHIQVAPMTMEGGNEAVKRLISDGGELPTALFFPLGLMAVAALPELHRAGIRIPDMMEIVTYGDHDAEKYSFPSLTTVKLPVEEMAAECIRLAIERILEPTSQPKSLVFETPFIFRESCAE